jgi:hypothetical protein
MLWGVKMPILKKGGIMLLFSGGIIVIVFAALRCTAILSDPENGGQQAGFWAVRESFAAVVTTNLPVIFPLFQQWLRPWLGSWIASIGYSNNKADKKEDSELVTFGRRPGTVGAGGTGGTVEQDRPNHNWNYISSESEDHIMHLSETQDVFTQRK